MSESEPYNKLVRRSIEGTEERGIEERHLAHPIQRNRGLRHSRGGPADRGRQARRSGAGTLGVYPNLRHLQE